MKSITRPSGFGAGFARAGGGGLFGKMLGGAAAYRPGGAGGMLSGLVQSGASLALMPARIVASFARLIPGIGGVLSNVVGGATNILQGLVGIAANVVGGILNVFTRLVSATVKIFGRVVRAAGRILGRLVKIAATVGLGAGVALGYLLLRGIKRNMSEAQLKEILKRRIGGAWQAAWGEIERVRRFGGFEVEELAEAMIRLQRADLKKPHEYLELMVDTAHGARASLQEVSDLFLRMAAGGGGRVGFMLQRFGFKPEEIKRIKNVRDLAAALEKKFGGVAKSIDRLDPLSNIWRNMRDAVRDLTVELAEKLTPWLNRVVDWLDRLRESDAFKRLAEDIGRAGEWLTEKFVAGIKAAWEWMTTRDWSKTWSGLLDAPRRLVDEVLPDVIGLFAVKTEQGLKAGPLTKAIVSGVEYIVAKVLGVLEGLWAAIRTRATETIAGVFRSMAGVLQQKAIDVLEKPKREAVAAARRRAEAPMSAPERGAHRLFGKSEEEIREERRQYARDLEARPASEFTPLPQDVVKGAAYHGAAEELFDTANAIEGAGAAAEDTAPRLAALGVAADNAAAAMSNALGATGAQTERIGGGIASILSGLFPARPPEELQAADAARAARAAGQGPGLKKTRERLASREELQRLLQRTGYTEAAEKVGGEIEDLKAAIVDWGGRVADGHDEHAQQIHDLERRVSRLGTTRK